jgi:hypothetical protein
MPGKKGSWPYRQVFDESSTVIFVHITRTKHGTEGVERPPTGALLTGLSSPSLIGVFGKCGFQPHQPLVERHNNLAVKFSIRPLGKYSPHLLHVCSYLLDASPSLLLARNSPG